MVMAWPDALEWPPAQGLRDHFRHRLTSVGYLVLLAIAADVNSRSARLLCLLLVVAIACLAWAQTYQRARAIADVATSRVASAAQGYAELSGRATGDASELLRSPCSGTVCIWYRFKTYTRDGGERGWREIDRGESATTFELNDGSGSCRVDPEHAEIIAPVRRVIQMDSERHVEELLPPGSTVFVLGEFTTVGGASTPLSEHDDVSALLAQWKRDPDDLRRRFELGGHGAFDLQEWEQVRRLATQAVRQQHREMRAMAELHLVRAPHDGRAFLISTLSGQHLRRRYLAWSTLHLAVAILAAGGLAWWWR